MGECETQNEVFGIVSIRSTTKSYPGIRAGGRAIPCAFRAFLLEHYATWLWKKEDSHHHPERFEKIKENQEKTHRKPVENRIKPLDCSGVYWTCPATGPTLNQMACSPVQLLLLYLSSDASLLALLALRRGVSNCQPPGLADILCGLCLEEGRVLLKVSTKKDKGSLKKSRVKKMSL